jgi:hypothetical protein
MTRWTCALDIACDLCKGEESTANPIAADFGAIATSVSVCFLTCGDGIRHANTAPLQPLLSPAGHAQRLRDNKHTRYQPEPKSNQIKPSSWSYCCRELSPEPTLLPEKETAQAVKLPRNRPQTMQLPRSI